LYLIPTLKTLAVADVPITRELPAINSFNTDLNVLERILKMLNTKIQQAVYLNAKLIGFRLDHNLYAPCYANCNHDYSRVNVVADRYDLNLQIVARKLQQEDDGAFDQIRTRSNLQLYLNYLYDIMTMQLSSSNQTQNNSNSKQDLIHKLFKFVPLAEIV